MIDAKWIAHHRALCEAATPGPWRWGDWRAEFGLLESRFLTTLEHNPVRGGDPERYARHREDRPTMVLNVVDDVENPADKRFIAAARAALPEALEEIERLRAEVAAAMRRGFEIAVEHAWISTHDGWHVTSPQIDWDQANKALDAALAGAGKSTTTPGDQG